jgi:hypothetical protein
MSGIQKVAGARTMACGFRIRSIIQSVLGVSVCMLLAGPAFAQYGGGGTGTGTGSSSSPNYSYGSGKAIGIGVGAAAGGAAVLYLALRHRGTVVGCVEPASDGMNLVQDKNKKTFHLLAGGADLQPGEHVQVQGKKSDSGAMGESFQAKKLVKNLGACGAPAASSSSLSNSTSVQSTLNSLQRN